MGVLLQICWIFSEHLSLRRPLERYFSQIIMNQKYGQLYAYHLTSFQRNLLRRNSWLTVPKNLRRCFRVMTNKSSIKAFYSTVTEIGQAEIFVMIIQKRNWYLYKILFLARKHFSGNRQLLRHKKWSFPFRTSLIKVNKSSENGGFLTSSK